MLNFVLDTENFVRKEENAGLPAFSPFPSKSSLSVLLKARIMRKRCKSDVAHLVRVQFDYVWLYYKAKVD